MKNASEEESKELRTETREERMDNHANQPPEPMSILYSWGVPQQESKEEKSADKQSSSSSSSSKASSAAIISDETCPQSLLNKCVA